MKPRAYIDRGRPGSLRFNQRGLVITLEKPILPVLVQKLALEAIQRHNSLEPELQGTHRVFLRWMEREGTGLPNPEAEKRETHYDPLPLVVQTKVTVIVDASPWTRFIRKLYSSTLDRGSLADQLGISRRQFYSERTSALWYFRGRFESERIYG